MIYLQFLGFMVLALLAIPVFGMIGVLSSKIFQASFKGYTVKQDWPMYVLFGMGVSYIVTTLGFCLIMLSCQI